VTITDRRLHGTTFRQPAEAFGDEQLRSAPAAYVGQCVEVQGGPEETVQLYRQGPLIASHPRQSGQHQLCVEPKHYQGLRQPPVMPSTRNSPPGAWP
jgi:hypothetical protein